jgi:hypothetical protein
MPAMALMTTKANGNRGPDIIWLLTVRSPCWLLVLGDKRYI